MHRLVSGRMDVEPDQTIEIIMTELDPEVMKIFTKEKVIKFSLNYILACVTLSITNSSPPLGHGRCPSHQTGGHSEHFASDENR